MSKVSHNKKEYKKDFKLKIKVRNKAKNKKKIKEMKIVKERGRKRVETI